MTQPATIHHLAPASQLWRCIGRDGYAPPSLAREGFVHCTAGRDLVLQVARDYYADLDEPLVVLAIDPARLAARLVFEAPAPIAGGGTAHLASGALFPHLYGALNLDAVTGAAELPRDGDRFAWPASFGPLARWLPTSVWRRDDNGNEVEMARDLAFADAAAMAARFESRGHEQTYWTAPTARDGR